MPPHRLLLVRHARAADAAVDRDRPLTDRGVRRATAIGTWLARAGPAPDRVLVSPARRAAQTWELAADAADLRIAPTVDERIYVNTVEAVLDAIQETPDEVGTLVVVGHNPSLGELAAALDDDRGDPAARQALRSGFPTGAVALFVSDVPFSDLAPGDATLTELVVGD